MKRVGNLYAKVCSRENLRLAHKNARKGKSFYQEVQQVNANPDYYLGLLRSKLKNHMYRTSEYTIFDKKEGKKVRTIYKLPYYPDRICQWAVMQVIEPYLIRNLTADTYSAIPGRGTDLARRRVNKALRNDPEGTEWCLKIDIKKYYPSIDLDILKQKYRKLFKDEELLQLIDEILDSNPDSGVPIGNYISQYSGNIYLSDFDHYVKEKLHVKHYFRYMDDMVFFGETKEELQKLLAEITVYLKDNLHLHVKENWSLFRVEDRGVDFVGYVFKHNCVRLRKSIAHSLKKASSRIRWLVNQGKMINRRLYFAINSLCGWLKHCYANWLRIRYVDTIWDYVLEYHDKVLVGKGGKLHAKVA